MKSRVVRIQTVSVLTFCAIWATSVCAQQPMPPGNMPPAGAAPPAFAGPMSGPSTPAQPSPQSGSPTSPDAPPPDVTPWPWAPPFWPPEPPGVNPRLGGGGGDFGSGDFGGHGMGGFGGIQPSYFLRYSTSWIPTVGVNGQATGFESFTENVSFGLPLWSNSVSAWSLTGGIRNEQIDTQAVIPLTGEVVPADLWGINLGVHYARLFANGWVAGGGVSIGSASDHPFWSLDEMNVNMNAMLRVPQNEHDSWIFTLMYSPLNELNFPIPGIAYNWNPSPEFHANLGLPFQLTWRPNDDWRFDASYMLLRTVHAKTQYRLVRWLSAFAAYDWSNEAYSLVDRPELNDRFFIYDQRASVGLQTAGRYVTSSISAGYVFDRFLYEGESLAPSRADSVDLGAGPFAALNLGLRF